ncbi:MAG: ABC transporter permease [Deltaproteobacteria bacterium]|nr:ABC transporter permease [Deltaproteobacteria bacterium]
MLSYLAKRLVFGAVVLLGTSLLTFLIAFVVPADPAVAMAGAKADPQTLAVIRRQLGLDLPVYRQYLNYLDRALHGDLGRSYLRRQDVARLIVRRFPATVALAVCAMTVALVLGVAMGVAAALRHDRAADRMLLGASLLLISTPVFWLGTLLLIAGGLYLRSFPLGGFDGARSLVLPALTLGLGMAGYYARLLQANLVEVLAQDYVRAAWAKRRRGARVLLRHALPNAALPLLTVAGLDLAGLLSGVVLTETVFDWPGIGRLAYEAVFNLDIPLIMGTVLFSALLVVVANLAVDLVYVWLDPRIRPAAGV